MTLTFTLDTLPQAAAQFIEATGRTGVYAFYAPMGAGKTTFINEVCRQLGVTDTVNSPTFSIVNEYGADTPAGVIYHLDLYRLNNAAEAADIGLEEYLYSDALCLIEWPERAEELLPAETHEVSISVAPDGTRTLTF